MNDWYYAVGQQQLGPVSREELVKLLANGSASPQTLVWNSSMTQWTPAANVPGLVPSPGTLGGFSASGPSLAATSPTPSSAGSWTPGSPLSTGPTNPYAAPTALSAPPFAPPAQSKWEGHVRAVSIILIVAGGLGLLSSLACGGFSTAVLSGVLPDMNQQDDAIMGSVLLLVSIIGLAMAGVMIAGGIQCLKFRGRVLGIVACVMCILAGAIGAGVIGIGLGVYGLVILCNGEVARLFEQRSGKR